MVTPPSRRDCGAAMPSMNPETLPFDLTQYSQELSDVVATSRRDWMFGGFKKETTMPPLVVPVEKFEQSPTSLEDIEHRLVLVENNLFFNQDKNPIAMAEEATGIAKGALKRCKTMEGALKNTTELLYELTKTVKDLSEQLAEVQKPQIIYEPSF